MGKSVVCWKSWNFKTWFDFEISQCLVWSR